MHATTKSTAAESSAVMLAVDLAGDVFELAFADANGRIAARTPRARAVASCLDNQSPLHVVMDAWGSSHC